MHVEQSDEFIVHTLEAQLEQSKVVVTNDIDDLLATRQGGGVVVYDTPMPNKQLH